MRTITVVPLTTSWKEAQTDIVGGIVVIPEGALSFTLYSVCWVWALSFCTLYVPSVDSSSSESTDLATHKAEEMQFSGFLSALCGAWGQKGVYGWA